MGSCMRLGGEADITLGFRGATTGIAVAVPPRVDNPTFATMTAPASPTSCHRDRAAGLYVCHHDSALAQPYVGHHDRARQPYICCRDRAASPTSATMTALANPASMTLVPARLDCGRRVSLASGGARPPAFATVSAPRRGTAYDGKAASDWLGDCDVGWGSA